jgi:hypothetical protein
MYISPYLALENLRRAALGRNTEALKEAVDFPDFRASLKEELKEGRRGNEEGRCWLSRPSGRFIQLSFEDQRRFVDLLLNPPALAPAMKRARWARSRLIEA